MFQNSLPRKAERNHTPGFGGKFPVNIYILITIAPPPRTGCGGQSLIFRRKVLALSKSWWRHPKEEDNIWCSASIKQPPAQPRWKLVFNYSCNPPTLLLLRPTPFPPVCQTEPTNLRNYWKSRRNSFAFREKRVYVHVDAFDFRKEKKKVLWRTIGKIVLQFFASSIMRINYALKTRANDVKNFCIPLFYSQR